MIVNTYQLVEQQEQDWLLESQLADQDRQNLRRLVVEPQPSTREYRQVKFQIRKRKLYDLIRANSIQ